MTCSYPDFTLALAAGFSREKFSDQTLSELTAEICADEKLLRDASEFMRLEISSPDKRGSTDQVFLATLKSYSHGDLAALRNRVLGARQRNTARIC